MLPWGILVLVVPPQLNMAVCPELCLLKASHFSVFLYSEVSTARVLSLDELGFV